MQRHLSRLCLRLAVRVVALGLVAGAVVSYAGPAMAAWIAGGAGSSGTAGAIMPDGQAPSGSANGLLITVSWGPASFANGAAVAGYDVARYNAATGQVAAVGGTCAGVVSATTCAETVPPGTWVYTDTPVQRTWTGGASPQSTAILALG